MSSGFLMRLQVLYLVSLFGFLYFSDMARGIIEVGACWKYYFSVMYSTDMFGQRSGYLGHGELGSN